jgi:hypothetical protein
VLSATSSPSRYHARTPHHDHGRGRGYASLARCCASCRLRGAQSRRRRCRNRRRRSRSSRRRNRRWRLWGDGRYSRLLLLGIVRATGGSADSRLDVLTFTAFLAQAFVVNHILCPLYPPFAPLPGTPHCPAQP